MRAEGTAAADVPADQDQGAIEIEENRFETAFQADCRRANLKRGASTSPAPPRTLIDGSLLGASRQPQSRAGDTRRPALIDAQLAGELTRLFRFRLRLQPLDLPPLLLDLRLLRLQLRLRLLLLHFLVLHRIAHHEAGALISARTSLRT